MANGMYTLAKQQLLDAGIDLNTDTIKIALVDDTYTFSAAETSMTTAGGDRIGTDQTLASVTITDGIFDAADPTWTAVAGGSTINGAVIYKFVTNDAGSTPINFIELTNTATNGSDITVNFDSGSNKIFKLTG